GCAGPGLDDDALLERCFEALGDDARGNVGGAPGGIGNDQPHLCAREVRGGGRTGGEHCGQYQHKTAHAMLLLQSLIVLVLDRNASTSLTGAKRLSFEHVDTSTALPVSSATCITRSITATPQGGSFLDARLRTAARGARPHRATMARRQWAPADLPPRR